jgi:hypothetical protein
MKNKYAVDNLNRLLIKQKEKTLLALGEFSIDQKNRLLYWLNEPDSWRREYGLPKKVIFKGSWNLTRNHDLVLVLDRTEEQLQGDVLNIKGNIISTDRDALAFEIKTYDQNGLLHIRILRLSVIWLTDETNRLSLLVKKSPPDIITLEGKWEINKAQQVTYTYEKTDLKTKDKTLKTLAFEGFWQISSANKLTYILKHSSESKFDFRVQIETPTIYPQKGVIKYRIGIGLKGLSPQGTVPKIISLYGDWKFSRNLGLSYQMDYGRGDIHEIQFAAEVNFDKRNSIIFALKNQKGEPLGISVTFEHRFLQRLDGRAYLRLKKLKEASGIEAGIRIPF